MHAETSRRIAANDYGRGIGIFLVVLGHVLIGLDDHGILSESANPNALTLSRAAVKWIYAFHMPLFFFLSGMLSERSVRKPFGEVLSSRVRAIAWPYVVWSLFQESLRELTGISRGSASDWWRILYKPMMQFWFLYVLFFLSLAYYGLRRLGVPRIGVLAIAAVLHAGHLSTEVPVMSWVYHEFCKHGLYLAAGAFVAEWFEHRTIPVASARLRLIAAAAGYLLIADWVAHGSSFGPCRSLRLSALRRALRWPAYSRPVARHRSSNSGGCCRYRSMSPTRSWQPRRDHCCWPAAYTIRQRTWCCKPRPASMGRLPCTRSADGPVATGSFRSDAPEAPSGLRKRAEFFLRFGETDAA